MAHADSCRDAPAFNIGMFGMFGSCPALPSFQDGGASDTETGGRSILIVRVVVGVKGPDYCDEDCVTRVGWTSVGYL